MSPTTLAFDFGNFELKYLDSKGQPRAIRSIHYRLPQGVNALSTREMSPVIEADGTRYHFGTQAAKYAQHEKTVIADKALLARLHLYACMEATEGTFDLVVSHHSPANAVKDLRKALVARHQFIRNGKRHDITVKGLKVVPEGIGAYWAAARAGFTFPTGYTIVIDLGGGTWLSRVIDLKTAAHTPQLAAIGISSPPTVRSAIQLGYEAATSESLRVSNPLPHGVLHQVPSRAVGSRGTVRLLEGSVQRNRRTLLV